MHNSWLARFKPTAILTALVAALLEAPGAVPVWQVAASLALLAGAGWVALMGSARIFRIGLLMYGKTPTLPEILRWARQR